MVPSQVRQRRRAALETIREEANGVSGRQQERTASADQSQIGPRRTSGRILPLARGSDRGTGDSNAHDRTGVEILDARVGVIGARLKKSRDQERGRRRGVVFTNAPQRELPSTGVNAEHRAVVGRHHRDGGGAGPSTLPYEDGNDTVPNPRRATAIDQGVGQRASSGDGCIVVGMGECDAFDQGLDGGRGQGGICSRRKYDLQRGPVHAIFRRVHGPNHHVGVADRAARDPDLASSGAQIGNTQLVGHVASRGVGDAKGSSPKIEPIVGEVVVGHSDRGIDLHRKTRCRIGLGVVQSAAQTRDHWGVVDRGDVDREGRGRFGHSTGVGHGVAKGHAAPVAGGL